MLSIKYLKTKNIILLSVGFVCLLWLISIIVQTLELKTEREALIYSLAAFVVASLGGVSFGMYAGNSLEKDANELIRVMKKVSEKDFSEKAKE
ncbi:MAG TPA: hypothetical protein ENJ96_02195, partial [Thermodesulfatator atlanticus]|nr:hypothetical protein [Thermodesulfatator atlanticus]